MSIGQLLCNQYAGAMEGRVLPIQALIIVSVVAMVYRNSSDLQEQRVKLHWLHQAKLE